MHPKKFQKKKQALKKAAKEQIITLFDKAKESFKTTPSKSHRLVRKARNLAMKHKLKIPQPYNRRYCRNCNSFLMPSKNCSVRTHKGHVVYFCKECRHYRRFPFKPRRS